jgi:hypothetical protein
MELRPSGTALPGITDVVWSKKLMLRIRNLVAVAIVGSWLPVGALACGDRPGLIRNGLAAAVPAADLQALLQADDSSVDLQDPPGADSSHRNTGIVGMWIAKFLVDDTTQVYDQAIMIFYADGNETENDIAVPPATQNVCYGVWERTGKGTFKVRHLGWVFDVTGKFAGTVELKITVSLIDNGAAFRGRYVLEQYDLAGNAIPADHAEGDLTATRYTIRSGMKR